MTLNEGRNLACNLRFCGQYEDEESGLFYNRFRYYLPETGQYLSPDPLGLAGGVNLYGYVPNPVSWIDPFGLVGCPRTNAVDKIPLSRNSARNLLKNRGLNKQIQHDTINSFDGQIYASSGRQGDIFTITEYTPGSASQVYVTRGSAGVTSAERRAKLALPPNNSASYEGKVALTRDQILLEGKVAPQLQWGADKTGGGWQVVTAGGKYSGATKSL
nr:RHS repeat-associated core domain-containing protein [Photorhabdus khanii]